MASLKITSFDNLNKLNSVVLTENWEKKKLFLRWKWIILVSTAIEIIDF